MNVKKSLFSGKAGRARYVVLLDPDKLTEQNASEAAVSCSRNGVDALFVGGSTADKHKFLSITKVIKEHSRIPVILFPGGADQIVPHADAVLFMSLLSGRNPRFLIEEQVRGAPLVREFGLETVAMGYLLIESDKPTAVEKVSGSAPLKRGDPVTALNHALAAQYLGMDVVYLEAGSGANLTVPEDMISTVKQGISIPLIVGGGIKTPEEASRKVAAGADIVVTGNVLEKSDFSSSLKAFAQAVHKARA